MSVQKNICTSEVFQIGVSDGSVHQLGNYQNINLYPARKFTGTRVLGACMHLQILMIPPIREHNSIFICEVFQIKVSDGPVHWHGNYQNINLYPARVFTLGGSLGV